MVKSELKIGLLRLSKVKQIINQHYCAYILIVHQGDILARKPRTSTIKNTILQDLAIPLLENREFHYQKHNTTRSGYALAQKPRTSTTKTQNYNGYTNNLYPNLEPYL